MDFGHAFEEHWADLQEAVEHQFKRSQIASSTHSKEQMIKRRLTNEDILFVLLNNLPDEMYRANEYPHGPNPFQNSDPVFSVTGRTDGGKWITVALAVRNVNHRVKFRIVTVINVSPTSRHRNRK